MKLLIALCFFILGTIQLGLLFGVFHYYRSRNLLQVNPYWLGSLAASVIALFTFGIGVFFVNNLIEPPFSFTIANTGFYIAGVLQLLFCQSLIGRIRKIHLVLFGVSTLIFFATFEYCRINASYEARVVLMCIVGIFFYCWQIYSLSRIRKKSPSSQLGYLQYVTAAELFFAVARLGVLFSMNLSLQFVEQIPQLLILTTIFQLVMNTLAYIAIGGYWTERLSLAGLQATEENQKVKSLLKEREELITSLLRANKTSVTGALSASIAHELNQPLGATNLNIQFLQKKLLAGELNPRLQSDILESLLADNERASKIIQSLRSIFSEEEASTEVIDLNEVIQSTISICKSELAFRKIQMVLSLEPSLKVKAGAGEMQQVILNLLNNAMQALEHVSMDNKQITIEGKHTPEGIRLCISDNGTGVPTENQPYLFDLLVGAKKTGMGLGLWLCKHIVSRYDGQIYYEEVASGGARFALSLPNK